MAFITADRVKDTSTTTGTGNITVSGSAPFGYRTFSTVLSVGDTFYYCIQGQGTAEWEVGLGTYASTNQFARTIILASSASGSAVSFSSGTKNVFITLPANKTLQFDATGSPIAGGILYGTGSMLAYSAAGTAGHFLQSTGGGAPTWVSAVTSSSIVNGTSNVSIVSANGAITAVTAGTTAMTIDTSQNVGIGTSLPGRQLEVNGSSVPIRASTADSNMGVELYSNAGTRYNWLVGAQYNVSGGFEITPSTAVGGTTYSTPALVITSGGNVGIGTSSPSYKLSVQENGNLNATVGLSNTTAGTSSLARFLAISDAGSAAFGFTSSTYTDITGAQDALLINANNASGGMAFALDGVVKMKMDSSGNLLVGQSSWSWSNNGTEILATGRIWNVSNTDYNMELAGSTTARVRFYTSAGGSGTTVGSITVTTSATAYNTSSDYRLKENVQPMIDGLATVSALKPVRYDWIADKSAGEGFIAHELAEIIPQAVTGEKDAVEDDGSIKPQGVDYSKIVVHLVAAIKELSAKNDALEDRLATLEGAK